MTKIERREYAILFLLYRGHMVKEEYEDAARCIDTIYKKWPWMKNEEGLAKIRANAVNKAKSKEAAKQK